MVEYYDFGRLRFNGSACCVAAFESALAEVVKMLKPLTLVRKVVSSVVRLGDFVVDATVGNGHDTELLARLVGDGGLVLGMDIQQSALAATTARLSRLGLSDRVKLVLSGHEHLSEVVRLVERPPEIRCAMFNLGYKPGSDESLVTQRATTVEALQAACDLLAPGGLVSVMVYPRHPGGADEAEGVEHLLRQLERGDLVVERYQNDMAPVDAAYAWLVSRPGAEPFNS
jgi:SAM-dependent methyltransferase